MKYSAKYHILNYYLWDFLFVQLLCVVGVTNFPPGFFHEIKGWF